MIAESLKKALLQAAIQGKLTDQLPEDGDARDLLKNIQKEKARLVKEGKIKKEKPLPEIKEEEIPFDIPENWVWARLQEISTINPRSQIPDDTVVSFVPMRLISEGYKNQFNHEQSLWKDVKSGFTHFADNDIVVAKITPCFENRKSVVMKGLLNSYGAGTTELHVIRPINDYIESEYLLFLLKTEYFISGGKLVMTGTAGQQRVGKNYIQELMCPIAPLPEQKRIIDLINSLLSEIENLEEDEQKLDHLEREFPGRVRSSILQAAIQGKLTEQLPEDGDARDLLKEIQKEKARLIKEGKIKKQKPLPAITEDEIPFDIPENWVWCRLSECNEMMTGNSIPKDVKTKKYTMHRDGLPYIGTKDVSANYEIDYENGVFIPLNEPGFKTANKDSTLMCVEGGSAGRKIAMTDREVCFGNKLCKFEAWKVNPKFIFYYLQTNEFAKLFKGEMTGIIGGVGIDRLKNIPICLPPIAEQIRVVEKLEDLLPLCERLE